MRRREVRRFVPWLPLDVAAEACPLLGGDGAAREECVDCGAQVAARDRAIVLGSAVVELPAIGEPPFGVVEEEVRRAGRRIRSRHRLTLVVADREREAELRRKLP